MKFNTIIFYSLCILAASSSRVSPMDQPKKPATPAVNPSAKPDATVALTQQEKKEEKEKKEAEELVELPVAGMLTKASNKVYGTDTNVISFLEKLKKHQRINPASPGNQKVLTSAVCNLERHKSQHVISKFLSLCSAKRNGHATATLDKTLRHRLRTLLKEEHLKNQQDALLKKYNEQAAALKEMYNSSVHQIIMTNTDIDHTYEVDGESDNEETHPVYLPIESLITVKVEHLFVPKINPAKNKDTPNNG